MEDRLSSFIYFLRQEIPGSPDVDPDTPINDLYEELGFDLLCFLVAAIQLEMKCEVEIPDELVEDDSQTLRQFIAKVSELPRVKEKDLEEFIKEKEALLSKAIKSMREMDNLIRRN